MATTTLETLWINLASDLSQFLTFPYMTALGSQPTIQISSDPYAGGNIRKTRQKGYKASLSVTLQAVTPAQRVLLEFDADNGGWLGETVCVRDDRGRKFYGYWGDSPPQITEYPTTDECDVTLTFTQITHSETV